MASKVIDRLKPYVPAFVRPQVRRVYRMVRAPIRRLRRNRRVVIGPEKIEAQLHAAGFGPGDLVMVHSSLSSIGSVDDGPQTVIQAFMNTVTERGTVIMPCYNSAQAVREGQVVDLRTQRPSTGLVTDVFRTWPGVLRSSHPFSSCCAWGLQAAYIVSSHADNPNVCHETSPVGRQVELGVKVVGIGVPISQGLAVAHYLEDTWADFPFEVHEGPFDVHYIDAEGQRVERPIYRYSPEMAETRIDHPRGRWINDTLTEHLTRRGVLDPFRLGNAESWVIGAVPLYHELKRLAGKNVTMYLTAQALDDRNREIMAW